MATRTAGILIDDETRGHFRARCTDDHHYDREARARYREHTREPNSTDCTTWIAEGRRHFDVGLRNGRGRRSIVHVRRAAWAIAFPHDPVQADEEITNTCETHGNNDTGEGICVNPAHLIKGKPEQVAAYNRERQHVRKAAAVMTRPEAA